MANSNQVLDLKGIHREMHSMPEQIRVMNELNARLVQHLTQAPALNHRASHACFARSPLRRPHNRHSRHGR